MAKQKGPVILGGDFNPWRPGSITNLENQLKRAVLQQLTKGTRHTFESNGLKFTPDHIFSLKGLDHTPGVHRQSGASNHFPVWMHIALDVEE